MSTETSDPVAVAIQALAVEGSIPDDYARNPLGRAVLLECARRYVADEHHRLSRKVVRSEEVSSITAEVQQRTRAIIGALVDEMSRGLEVKWTRQLLHSRFSLGDGTVTLWGDAEPEQHIERASLLEKFAAGNMETAALHRRAASDIREAGVRSLSALVERVVNLV